MKGWRNESWRHSLAAKGVKTKQQYMKGKLAMLMETKKTDEEEMFKVRQLDNVREESFRDLNEAVERGKMTADDAARFWKDDFEPEKDLFMNNGQPFEQFRENVARKRKSHIERFGKTLPIGL